MPRKPAAKKAVKVMTEMELAKFIAHRWYGYEVTKYGHTLHGDWLRVASCVLKLARSGKLGGPTDAK